MCVIVCTYLFVLQFVTKASCTPQGLHTHLLATFCSPIAPTTELIESTTWNETTEELTDCPMLPTQLDCYNSCIATMDAVGYNYTYDGELYASGFDGWQDWEQPVCGFDGVQYYNFCEFKCTSVSTQYFYRMFEQFRMPTSLGF